MRYIDTWSSGSCEVWTSRDQSSISKSYQIPCCSFLNLLWTYFLPEMPEWSSLKLWSHILFLPVPGFSQWCLVEEILSLGYPTQKWERKIIVALNNEWKYQETYFPPPSPPPMQIFSSLKTIFQASFMLDQQPCKAASPVRIPNGNN